MAENRAITSARSGNEAETDQGWLERLAATVAEIKETELELAEARRLVEQLEARRLSLESEAAAIAYGRQERMLASWRAGGSPS